MLVTQGMGQQVPYETLSAIGQALVTQYTKGRSSAASAPTVSVRRVTLTSANDAPEISRAEVTLQNEVGEPVDVHVCYWAPFTEGQISFLQTVGFLYSSAWNGIKTCLSAGYGNKTKRLSFERWIFGDFREMEVKRGTFLTLLLLVASISLLLIPAVLLFTPAGMTTAKWIGQHYESVFLSWNPLIQALTLLVLVLLVVFAYWLHYFIVEFAGDVAIYVPSYKVSRFDTIRNNILKEACSLGRQIYSAGIADKHEQLYDNVVIVGHSLGSVISYDLLNSNINWDQVECGSTYRVVERTTHLITFGSPLDKTAFLFRTQVSSGRNLREALAARQQPLILDYQQFRPIQSFKWINIYSPMDIVSGHLDYYDHPGDPHCNPVENRIDRDAWKPLLAHTQYWNNEELQKTLYEAAWACAHSKANAVT